MTALAMIEATAAQQPGAVAIEEADGTPVTYAALLARARQIARSIAPGTRVHVVPAMRSADFVAGCLGAWFAGAAWAPIDPYEPVEREAAIRARLEAARDPVLAYVIPTSGSSGTPKAVMVPHHGLPALLRAQITAFELAPGARSLWLHAPIFDASLSDWATALASGATLVIPRLGAAGAIARELSSRAITHVDLPPALLPQLARVSDPLRVVVLGGEPCPVERVRALAAHVRVVVVYGPTEATVCSSLVAVDPATWARPLIGAPIEDVAYRVVDGELHIAGPSLALGYAGDPVETAQRFVEHDGTRWFRTGDLVEPVPGGLAFAGRRDRQRKIGGRRVELGEIEAVLRRAPGVIDAAVDVRAIAGRDRVIAFVEGEPVTRAWLRAHLPTWMTPARVVTGALPRTATGKVDRGALARLALPKRKIEHADPLTAELAAAWCDALGVEEVAAGDRLRDAGGDSLAELVLHAAAAARGIALDPAVVARDPSFEQLVEHARAAETAQALTVAECERRARQLAPARAAQRRGPGRAVLVTGATGRLGTALLPAWRVHDDRRMIALVRRPSEALRARLGVELLAGELALPRLGLSEAAWTELAADVGAIVHAGAVIQLHGDWEAHAPVNVGGTAEIVRLAAEAGAALHHVSTLSVFVATDRGERCHAEAAVPDPHAHAFGGYAQTKIAAEALARAAWGREAPTTVFRLGLLVGGAPRAEDQLGMTIRGLARLGSVPAARDELRFDLTPIDFAARAVAQLALAAERDGADRAHHVAGVRSATLGELADAMRTCGTALAELPAPVWAERASAELVDPDIAMAYLALGRAHADPALYARLRRYDLFLATCADFDVAATHAQVGVPAHDLAALVAAALELA